MIDWADAIADELVDGEEGPSPLSGVRDAYSKIESREESAGRTLAANRRQASDCTHSTSPFLFLEPLHLVLFTPLVVSPALLLLFSLPLDVTPPSVLARRWSRSRGISVWRSARRYCFALACDFCLEKVHRRARRMAFRRS